MNRAKWMIGMIGSVAAALGGNALPEPYSHWVTTIAAIAAAITGYQIQHPPPDWDGIDRRGEHRSPSLEKGSPAPE